MDEKDLLSGAEQDAFVEDLSDIVTGLIHDLVSLADKHNADRDNVVQFCAELFSTMVQVSTFQNFNVGGKDGGANAEG